jgi:DNA mismatch endonuclease (patch repair protein)
MAHLTKEKRSRNMSKIRSKNTKPELFIRSFLHKNGIKVYVIWECQIKNDIILSKMIKFISDI